MNSSLTLLFIVVQCVHLFIFLVASYMNIYTHIYKLIMISYLNKLGALVLSRLIALARTVHLRSKVLLSIVFARLFSGMRLTRQRRDFFLAFFENAWAQSVSAKTCSKAPSYELRNKLGRQLQRFTVKNRAINVSPVACGRSSLF